MARTDRREPAPWEAVKSCHVREGGHCGVTVMLPVMLPWIVQWKVTVPALDAVMTELAEPELIVPASHEALSATIRCVLPAEFLKTNV